MKTKRNKMNAISAADDLKQKLQDPDFADAYYQRRYVHQIAMTVRQMREAAGLSQRQLAEMIGTKQPAIARLETSQEHTPRLDLLYKIAGALDKQLVMDFVDVKKSAATAPTRLAARAAVKINGKGTTYAV